ncbi:hydroxycarboxylic acid receptor 2-like [Astyanax mexicanus]|uniref:Hydroxycarboxylic acid receptor 2 n=1 Tax=Astyanax mexicanus TaxID=7994 RepID=A0A8B9HTD4_ASTMX|nr:hydroxycarboxylic acid receptor 2-like [Astyanax mexicanus]
MSFYNIETHCNLTTQPLVSSIMPPLLIVELLLGLPGNLMALWVFSRHLRSWMPNVVYLLNLVLADFLLLVSLPFRIDHMLRDENWVFGDAWCRINLFMLAINRSASIGFMTVVAVDRYFKVVHPHHRVNFITVRQAAGIAGFIWFVVISSRLPLLANDLLIKKNNLSLCRSFNPFKVPPPGILLHYIMYLSEFFLSFIVLVFCSARIYCVLRRRQIEKKKKARQTIGILLVIVAIFLLFFFPGVALGLSALYLKSLGEKYCEVFRFNGQLFVLAIGFTYLNSVLDPVIYGFCSSIFRDAVKKAISQFALVKCNPSHNRWSKSGSHNDRTKSEGDI